MNFSFLFLVRPLLLLLLTHIYSYMQGFLLIRHAFNNSVGGVLFFFNDDYFQLLPFFRGPWRICFNDHLSFASSPFSSNDDYDNHLLLQQASRLHDDETSTRRQKLWGEEED